MSTLGYVGSDSGWDSKATLSFIATISDDGDVTWQQVYDYLEDMNLSEEVIKSIQLQYDVANSSWDTWQDLTDFLDGLGFTEVTTEKIKAAYDASGSTWASWSDVEAALAAAGVEQEAITTFKTEWYAQNDWANWSEVENMLTQMGIDQEQINTIKTQYDNAGSDLSMSALEAILAGAGLSTDQVMSVKSELSGTVQVDLTEMDYWGASLAFLAAIRRNTEETAKQLGGNYSTWTDLANLYPDIYNWSYAFSPAGLSASGTGTGSLPISGSTSGGTITFPDYQKVYLYGGNGYRIDGNSDGLIRTETFPTQSWSNEILAQGNSLSRIADYTYYSWLNLRLLQQGFSRWSPSHWAGYYKFGGIASGPESGYEATLHGTELVVSPLASYPATVVGGVEKSEEPIIINLQVVTDNGEITKEEVIKIARDQADDIRIKTTRRPLGAKRI